MGEMMIKQ